MAPDVKVTTLRPCHVASIRMSTDVARLRRTVEICLDLVMECVGEQGLAPAGPLFARFHRFDTEVDVEAGVPLAQPIVANDCISAEMLPGGTALHVRHFGDHADLQRVRAEIVAYGHRHGFRVRGAPWQFYVLDGRDTAVPAEWVTDVYLPVRRISAPNRR